MSGPKLTAAQTEILRQLCKPDARAYWMGAGRDCGYWFMSETLKRCTPQMEKLVKIGYAANIKEDWRGSEARVTDAGREALAQLDAATGAERGQE